MTEAEQNIRESLLNTLAFLASSGQQIEFALKVHYEVYQDEFACWWFDTFYPDEPEAHAMFTVAQLDALRKFSGVFRNATHALQNQPMSIHTLQSTSEWVLVVASAVAASSELRSAA